MKAAIIERFGPPAELKLAEMDIPVPGPGQVLVRILAAGLNPVDAKIRSGSHVSARSLQLPAVLGKEMSGIVQAVGEGVREFVPGDAVMGFLDGAYAEYGLTVEEALVKKPENVSFERAAGLPLAGLTAFQALHEQLKLKKGERILVQAAAGGVGHLAVQLARLEGAFVAGTASKDNMQFLESLGVDEPIDYRKERFEERLRGLDAVLEAIGGEVLYRSIECVRPGGRLLCLPSSTRDDPRALELAGRRGVQLYWFMMRQKREQLLRITELMGEGKLKLEVDKVFALEDIVQAHEALESHRTRGKIIINIRSIDGE